MDLSLIADAAAAYKKGATEAQCARLAFFEELHKIQQKQGALYFDGGDFGLPDADVIADWYWTHTPALTQAPLAIDAASFARTAEAISAHFADNAGLDFAVATALRSFDWERFATSADLTLAGSDPRRFLEECSHVDMPADLSVDIVLMVLASTLRAVLTPYSQVFMEAAPEDDGIHDHPLVCPVCGSSSSASFVGHSAGTDGRGRMQYCSQCGAQWEFERVRCGNCGTQSQASLHYFNVEGDEAHRLQTCDECGSYHRVVFEDEVNAPLCMEVEDVVMARLDHIANDPRFEGGRNF